MEFHHGRQADEPEPAVDHLGQPRQRRDQRLPQHEGHGDLQWPDGSDHHRGREVHARGSSFRERSRELRRAHPHGDVRAGKAAQAKADLVLAYNDGCATGAGVCPGPGRPPGTIEADLSGLVLAPGVYTSGSTMTIATNGTAVLDGQGNSNAVWIFQIASSLTAGVGSNVVLTNGAKAANVFWIIGASSTIGGGASFKGTVLARTSNTVGTAAVVEGRLVCTDGAISLLSDTITLPAP